MLATDVAIGGKKCSSGVSGVESLKVLPSLKLGE